jgi:hypothetical protein
LEKIILSEASINRLNELIRVLFDEEYFGFVETAIDYALKIYEFIKTIPNRSHRLTKNPHYGTFYCRYKANNRTDWYILFDKENDQYLIKNIINNHTREYTLYIGDGNR